MGFTAAETVGDIKTAQKEGGESKVLEKLQEDARKFKEGQSANADYPQRAAERAQFSNDVLAKLVADKVLPQIELDKVRVELAKDLDFAKPSPARPSAINVSEAIPNEQQRDRAKLDTPTVMHAERGDGYWHIAARALNIDRAKATPEQNIQIAKLTTELQAFNGNKPLDPGDEVKLPPDFAKQKGTEVTTHPQQQLIAGDKQPPASTIAPPKPGEQTKPTEQPKQQADYDMAFPELPPTGSEYPGSPPPEFYPPPQQLNEKTRNYIGQITDTTNRLIQTHMALANSPPETTGSGPPRFFSRLPGDSIGRAQAQLQGSMENLIRQNPQMAAELIKQDLQGSEWVLQERPSGTGGYQMRLYNQRTRDSIDVGATG